jgi:hypothetical protein
LKRKEIDVSNAAVVLGSSAPGDSVREKFKLSALRGLKTFLQGVAASLPTGGAGAEILEVGYWEMVGVAIIAAAFAGLASFIQNISTFLPDDPTVTPKG